MGRRRRRDRVLFRYRGVSLILPAFEFWVLFAVQGKYHWYWWSVGRDWKFEFLTDRADA